MSSPATRRSGSGPWGLRADLITIRSLLWLAQARRGGEFQPEVHLYLYDRYWRLAEHYERRGNKRKALRLRIKAEAHYRQSGHDGPPFAAAIAMPVPRPPLFTRAVATDPARNPDDVA